jgi:hypothetical protein
VRVRFNDSIHINHNMSGRFWVGVLIGLSVAALVFALT